MLIWHSAGWSKTENKCLNSSSVAQLAFLKMVQQLLVFHFVCPSTSESRSELATGILRKALLRTEDPTCLCYHSIYHLTQDISSMCVSVCVFVCAQEGHSHWQKEAKLLVRPDTQREIGGLSQQTMKMCVRVWESERETQSEWDNIPQNPLVLLALALCVLSRDRTSHVRFQNSSQFQGRPHFKR